MCEVGSAYEQLARCACEFPLPQLGAAYRLRLSAASLHESNPSRASERQKSRRAKPERRVRANAPLCCASWLRHRRPAGPPGRAAAVLRRPSCSAFHASPGQSTPCHIVAFPIWIFQSNFVRHRIRRSCDGHGAASGPARRPRRFGATTVQNRGGRRMLAPKITRDATCTSTQ